MRIWLAFAVLMACAVPWAQGQQTIPNPGFESLDVAGKPVDWELLGPATTTTEAHSGKVAMLLERQPGLTSECGLNLRWKPNSGEQGAMLSELKGGLTFWYRADSVSPDGALEFSAIPMSDKPIEGTGEQRSVFRVPPQNIGDGKWHQGILKYDYAGKTKVKWIQVSPRVRGDQARMLLDDIAWVAHVGPLVRILSTRLEELPGQDAEACQVIVTVKNDGDQPLGAGVAAIELPAGLSTEGGPLRTFSALPPDDTVRVAWKVYGRRDSAGKITVSVKAGNQEDGASVSFAPALEVVSLAPREFVISAGKTTPVVLTLRNAGHAAVRGVQAELRPGVPLTIVADSRRQSVERIAPGAQVSVVWQVRAEAQSPQAWLRANVSAGGSETTRVTSSVVVGGALPAFTRPVSGVSITDSVASIGNDKVRMVLPKADFGWGIAVLQQRSGSGWRTLGKLARLTRIVSAGANGKPAQRLVYADAVTPGTGPDGVPQLELAARVTDDAGVKWTVSETISLLAGRDEFALSVRGVPDRPAELYALDGPIFYAGEGSPAGMRRLDAIFPGLEWLAEGEESSSTLDIAADHPHRIRYVPNPHMVTIPMMCARFAEPSEGGVVLSFSWDQRRPYFADHDRPSAMFASPDPFEGRSCTVMGLFAPSMPDYIQPNARVAHTPLEVGAAAPVELTARLSALPVGPGGTALEALKPYFRDNPVPEPNPLPHGKTLADELQFSMHAYLTSLWVEEEQKWKGSIGGPAGSANTAWWPANLYDMRMCLAACPPSAMRDAVQERYDLVVGLSGARPQSGDEGFQFAGPMDRLMSMSEQASSLIRSQKADGSWRFSARVEKSGTFKGKDYSELGPDGAAEVGTCARNAYSLLRIARMTGDPQAAAAGIRALGFMDQYTIPRAAQVWEVPVHTPDILASSDACEAYLEGFQITGDRRMLDKAVYWAWTGLPFLYMWDEPGYEFLKYASIPVFGATWFRGSWFGRPVQWNGLRYAYAVAQLAPYDRSLDWAKVARGVTISCMYQQSDEDKDRALWPDSIDAYTKARSGWIFSPSPILQNAYWMMGLQPTPLTVAVPAGSDKIRVSAAGQISDVSFVNGRVAATVTFEPPQVGYAVFANVTKPGRITVNGAPVPEERLPLEVEGAAWRYGPADGMVEVKLAGTGRHEIVLEGVRWTPANLTPKPVARLQFGFDDGAEGWLAARDLLTLNAAKGVLMTDVTGPDPYMIRSNCMIPAAGVKQIRIRMALEPGLAPGAQVFWTCADSPAFEEAKSLRFTVIPDGEFHDYIVPVGTHDSWTGTITALRLDPTGGVIRGWVRIDSIVGE
jgi:hypothetical protein